MPVKLLTCNASSEVKKVVLELEHHPLASKFENLMDENRELNFVGPRQLADVTDQRSSVFDFRFIIHFCFLVFLFFESTCQFS